MQRVKFLKVYSSRVVLVVDPAFESAYGDLFGPLVRLGYKHFTLRTLQRLKVIT